MVVDLLDRLKRQHDARNFGGLAGPNQFGFMGLIQQTALIPRRQRFAGIDHRFELFFFAIGEGKGFLVFCD